MLGTKTHQLIWYDSLYFDHMYDGGFDHLFEQAKLQSNSSFEIFLSPGLVLHHPFLYFLLLYDRQHVFHTGRQVCGWSCSELRVAIVSLLLL